jgi:cytosine/adenosine deaminase-related metal-dependent hydrolase
VIYRADWVHPIAGAPIRDGWVEISGDRIVALGSGQASGAVDLGRAVVLPALVNAHTHLELSYLAGRIPPASTFPDWVRTLLGARRERSDPTDPVVVGAARSAASAARRAGTGLVGEVANTLVTVPLLAEAGLAGQVFLELLGFDVEDPDAVVRDARTRVQALAAATVNVSTPVRIGLAPHAPYSVSPAMFSALRADLDAEVGGRSSVHLAESPDELELLATGTGGCRQLLEELGAWTDAWKPPGDSPVAYLSTLGFLDSRVAVVHGTQCSGDDLECLRGLDICVVSCPRSNRHVGVGSPPLEAFYAVGVTVAFGTDSLASVETLSVFDELVEARRIAPRVPARRLLESATLGGARALGFGDEFGTIEPGKRAQLIAVPVPNDETDVEEYLVSGVEPAVIEWLETDPGRSSSDR